jgi:hypothetical protein
MADTRKPPPPFAPAGAVRRMASGRWAYKSTGRIAPTVNGRPLAEGWRKDKRGRVYNVARRREVAIKNFRTGITGKKPAQSRNLGARAGLVLWKGPPAPRWPTAYMAIDERDRLTDSMAWKRSALTAWCDNHAVPATKRPKGERAQHLMMNHWRVTVARHAQAWATVTLAWIESRGIWVVAGSTPISDEPAEARSMGLESRDSYATRAALPMPDGPPQKPADLVSLSIPIRRAR